MCVALIGMQSVDGMQAPDIDSDLFVEVLGILVNVDIPSYDWPSLIAKHDLLNLLAGQCHTFWQIWCISAFSRLRQSLRYFHQCLYSLRLSLSPGH